MHETIGLGVFRVPFVRRSFLKLLTTMVECLRVSIIGISVAGMSIVLRGHMLLGTKEFLVP